MSYFAHPTAVIDEPCEIGEGTKIWHFSHIMSHCKIGKNCNLGQNVVVSPKVILGNNVRVQNNVSIYEGVVCEDDVFLGPSMVLTNVINPRSAVSRKAEFKTTLIKKALALGPMQPLYVAIQLVNMHLLGQALWLLKRYYPML